MEEEYIGQCDGCDVETRITVINEEEVPLFCPMCGYTTDFEPLED